MIIEAGAEISGILIALDRQEKGAGDSSAVQEVSQKAWGAGNIDCQSGSDSYLREK